MAETLVHRGPDAGGTWVDDGAGVGLGHRRLSVIDLSPAGAQPMVSSCGRYVLCYNGEIYNADELRPLLADQGRTFRGHSDTEVIVEGCAAWGVRSTVERLIGMFAFALWDRQERRLSLVRDRLGIKPLYWSSTADGLLFGSELKALCAHRACPRAIDRDAVAAFLRLAYIPAPHTIYRGVAKLEPGCVLTLEGDGAGPVIERFWSLAEQVRAGRAAPFVGSDGEAVEACQALLMDAVGRRMAADVPLGALLSGGVDSSAVVALMQAQSARRVRTFSIGFETDGFDEARHAAAVARHLDTDHTELTVTARQARDVIPSLPDLYDEPFADASQIPTVLVSALTRRAVTVALSGDGGDEVFAGYTRYLAAARFGRVLARTPRPLRAALAGAIRTPPPALWETVARALPPSRRPPHLADRLDKIAAIVSADPDGFHRRLVSQWQRPEELALGGREPEGALWDGGLAAVVPDPVERMQYRDTLGYLPDDILAKVDRASMAASLEVRVPLLDHRVVALAWSLPRRLKIRDGTGKWVLRRVLARHLPTDLVERPKMGFAAPVGDWLRGPLRDWAQDLLTPAALERYGLVAPAPVQTALKEHVDGGRSRAYPLWCVLMLQSWCRRWLG